MSRVILHCDMNSFYASVESMLRPELKKYPIAVCGETEERHGIVLAKNILAAGFGIKTGDTVWEAKRKCSGLVTVKPNFDEYLRFSKLAREIYGRYTALVEPFGLDECWLDVTGSTDSTVGGKNIADRIRESVKKELGLTVSVGVSFNKVFAKLGSDLKKPDAVTVIPKENYLSVIGQLPVSSMLGVGPSTEEKLRVYCVETISELAGFSEKILKKLLGKCGEELWLCANGLDSSPVVCRRFEVPDKSAGNGITLSADLDSGVEVWKTMLELSQELGHRLTIFEKEAMSVAIQIKDSAFNIFQWQCPLPVATQSPYLIAKSAYNLFRLNYNWDSPVRAVTVRTLNLRTAGTPVQLNMFNDESDFIKNVNADKAVEDIRRRFGNSVIKNAVTMTGSGGTVKAIRSPLSATV